MYSSGSSLLAMLSFSRKMVWLCGCVVACTHWTSAAKRQWLEEKLRRRAPSFLHLSSHTPPPPPFFFLACQWLSSLLHIYAVWCRSGNCTRSGWITWRATTSGGNVRTRSSTTTRCRFLVVLPSGAWPNSVVSWPQASLPTSPAARPSVSFFFYR